MMTSPEEGTEAAVAPLDGRIIAGTPDTRAQNMLLEQCQRYKRSRRAGDVQQPRL